MKNKHIQGGYTLVELIVAVGLFALVMMLASGAYLMMIGISRRTQSIASGIDNLSFALETMTRTIRTSTSYGCPTAGIDCSSGGATFSVKNPEGNTVSYTSSNSAITQTTNGVTASLTDSSIKITSLKFYAVGTQSYSANGNQQQARVTIIVSGTVSSGPGRTVPFTVETGATMRGSDI